MPSLPFQRAALVSGRHRHRQAAHPARQPGTVCLICNFCSVMHEARQPPYHMFLLTHCCWRCAVAAILIGAASAVFVLSRFKTSSV